jgi:prepilin-type N-terminal cleavage/methylation domain-containing protein
LNKISGFTLIEVLIAAAILLSGLVAVTSVFSFAIRTNGGNRQTAVATTLLYKKMEEFRARQFTDDIWLNVSGSETVVIGNERYFRSWTIIDEVPRKVTVVVFTKSALTDRTTELIRATTLLSPTF